ncbi:exodeoxyribonuclease V subunit beta [Shewanella surugensis]|uniref:RecBCD enzyme subunit RecB n=2 Tax=Shewanella surugensis TaxID=212020 RepID=A0ABT0LFF6_9GAMM|nr:exodeoxyribonuclease V subunit beta [Shewanella surugensis]MCL1126403.1 exodeoxyribonuclease V subunit beta [Shewanella surugensis]
MTSSESPSPTSQQDNVEFIHSASLDTLTLPLTGTRLIEASAGTGKTYTISGLYLRLLLGVGIESPLSCEQILVVTFTNAATAELRDRIRKRVQATFKGFMGLKVDDDFINQLYEQTPVDARPVCLRRLDLALKSLDEAAIFTIHGFCQRILADLAFESSLLFESEFTLDDSEFLHHAVRDFWREHCYAMPENIAGIIQKDINDPEVLGKQLRSLLGASLAIAAPKPMAFDKLIERLNQSLKRFFSLWPQERENLETLLHALPLNGARFGKLADHYPKLAKMFDELDNWITSTDRLPPMKVLSHLSLNALKLNKKHPTPTPNEAPLLAHIEQIHQLFSELLPAFLYQARSGISLRFIQQKAERNLMTPDDLLLTLANALSAKDGVNEANKEHRKTEQSEVNGPDDDHMKLAKHIALRFPVALIDEFQDTDPLQFTIFSQIYQQALSSDHLGLLMIGDPKQAIYAFRGADIHTYIQAREQTQHHYSLDTNYRSSKLMIKGVNCLFDNHNDAFMSQSIPFEAVKAADRKSHKALIETVDNTVTSSALRIQLLSEEPEKGLNKVNARIQLAEASAEEISRLLTLAQQGHCQIEQRAVVAKDIAILVRDRNEAAVIKKALRQRQIGAVFLSRDSVYDTLEAREMAILLNAMALPKNEQALRSAMATQLLGFNCEQIQKFNQDEEVRQALLEQFFQLHQLWNQRGIMPALLFLAKETQLIERLLASHDGERRLTDFRHLAELLQQKSTEIDGCNALLNWYQQALIDNAQAEENQLRLESEQNLVQIVTIHKSKGLEYPICFLPFVSLARSSRKPSTMLYHKDGQLIWDLLQTDEGFDAYKQETLAEDLRLLYVALTRPIYRCYLSIANQSRFTKKDGLKSQLHETAIGYLLGIKDAKCEYQDVKFAAEQLACDAITINEINDAIACTPFYAPSSWDQDQTLSAKILKRTLSTPWRVGSYSGLVKNVGHEKVLPGADDEGFPEVIIIDEEEDASPSRFTFERGANAGSFMHLVLELIDFTQAETDLEQHLPQAMSQYGFDESWQPVLKAWYLDLLTAPLNQAGSLSLAQLPPETKLVEMEFYLPINTLNAHQLNTLLSQYGYSAQLQFDDLKGMLKGFIDLTFEYQGQFYIADYKSNHLGKHFEDYHRDAMSQAIASHRYDLQYIIYTLALHRYLKLRLPHYDFDQHMGGSYYLFLRGMSNQHPLSGVFYDKPPKALIFALDDLFEGKAHPHSQEAPSYPMQQEPLL